MKKIFEKKGFRDLIIKSVVFVGLLALVQVVIKPLTTLTPIPDELKPIFLMYFGDVLIFGVCIFIIYNRKQLTSIKKYPARRTDWLIFGTALATLLVFYYALRYSVGSFMFWMEHPLYFIILRYSLLALIVSSIAVGVYGRALTQDIYKTYKKQFLLFPLFLIAYYQLILFVRSLWPIFSGIVAHLTSILLGFTYSNVSLTISPNGLPTLVAGSFGARIGSPCSGIASMLLFMALFLIIVIVDRDIINFKRVALVFFPALAGVFLLNVVRIYLLFMVAINISKDLAVGLFHTNVGWILFCAYFFVFLWFVYPWMVDGKGKNHKESNSL